MARSLHPAKLPSYRQVLFATLIGACAWVGVVLLSRSASMGMGATMGMAPLEFLGAWALMMAAMMLPSVAPVAWLYAQAMGERRPERLAQFSLGYLLVWTLLGVPAFFLAMSVDSLLMFDPALIQLMLIGVLLGLAVYQLTPLKRLCLSHCRSPLSQLLRYASFRGPLRDAKVGARHGLFCTGCCWPLMLLLVAAGVMNLVVMLALTVAIAAEKLLPRGELVTRVIAVGALAAAVLIAASPALLSHLVTS